MGELSSYTRLAGQLMIGPEGEFGRINEGQAFDVDPELSRIFGNYVLGFLRAYIATPDDPYFRIGLIYRSNPPKQWGAETLLFNDHVVRQLYPVSGSAQNSLTTFQQKKRENSVHQGTELLLEHALKDTPTVPIFIPVLFDRGLTLGQYTASIPDAATRDDPNTPVLEVLNLVGPPASSRQNMDAFTRLKDGLKNTLVKKHMRQSLESKLASGMRSAVTPAAPTSVAATPVTATAAAAPTEPVLNTNKSSPQWYAAALDHPTARKLQSYLTNPREYIEPEKLRHFIRLRELTIDQLRELADNCPIYSAPQGTALLDQGSTDLWNLFLLRGEVKLVAADGEDKTIGADTPTSASAVATLRPRKFHVTAASSVRFLLIHDAIIVDVQQRRPGSGLSLL